VFLIRTGCELVARHLCKGLLQLLCDGLKLLLLAHQLVLQSVNLLTEKAFLDKGIVD
jgi:hypothetical protein